jgi:hypothetical protein
VEELLAERGPFIATNDSWRVDETYIRVKDKWHYLYRPVDSEAKRKRVHFVTPGCGALSRAAVKDLEEAVETGRAAQIEISINRS